MGRDGKPNAQRLEVLKICCRWQLNLPRIPPDERLRELHARNLVGPAVSCRRPSFLGGRYEWTDHQAFDPNRDNRHFERGSFCA